MMLVILTRNVGKSDGSTKQIAGCTAANSVAVFGHALLMQFFGYLRRDPDSAPDTDFSGYNFWLGKLNEFQGDFIKAEMVKAFITSIEYGERFGQ